MSFRKTGVPDESTPGGRRGGCCMIDCMCTQLGPATYMYMYMYILVECYALMVSGRGKASYVCT